MTLVTGIAGNLRAVRFNSFQEEKEFMAANQINVTERYEYSNGSVVVLVK
jgi:hypothetical protein